MKIYRVSYSETCEGHWGYTYHANKKEAEKAARDWCNPKDWEAEKQAEPQTTIECFTVRLTPNGVIGALNSFGGHNNNG